MIRLLSLFSGIGAFESALRRGGYQFETVNYCEIDPYAAKAYSQIHEIPEGKNLHDVREVNTLLMDNINLMTWGWPCQDISVAGKQRGFTDSDGNRTRSGLFFEGLRILTELHPEYAIAENVKALTSKKFTAEFQTVLSSLSEVGYNNYWKVLNAKDFGIPQNRERIFIISIRKDIDTGTFTFPEKQELKLRVKDVLEPVVDEKYYINNERAKNLIEQIKSRYIITESTSVDGTILEPKVIDDTLGFYDEPKIHDKTVPTLRAERYGLKVTECNPELRIRKLTPKECFRLMGFTDEEFDRIHGISNTQLYKMAGNSIVVNVLEAIFKQLFKENRER